MREGGLHLEPLRFKGDTVGGTLGQTYFLRLLRHARAKKNRSQRGAREATSADRRQTTYEQCRDCHLTCELGFVSDGLDHSHLYPTGFRS